MGNDLKRRLDALEAQDEPRVFIVSRFHGMSREDAFRLRFGDAKPPERAEICIIYPALPPRGVPFDWATNPGTEDYQRHWDGLREAYIRLDANADRITHETW